MNKLNKIILWIIGLIVVIGLVWLGYSDKKVVKEEGDVIKIGAVLPLSGAASYPGEEAQLGIDLAIKEINEGGGINGKKIKYIVEDSKSSPADGVSAFNKLVDVDEVDLIISTLSSVSMAIAPLAKTKEIPVLAFFTTAKDFNQSEYTFRYQPITDIEIKPILYILDRINSQKIGIIYLNDELGSSVFNELSKELENRGKEVFNENFLITEGDFQTQLTKIMSKDIDSLYIIGYYSHIINIVKKIRTLNYEGSVIFASMGSIPVAREAIKDISEGIYLATPLLYCSQIELSEESKKLDSILKTKNNSINHYNGHAYDTIKLLEGALSEADFKTREDIRIALENYKKHSGIFGDLIISDNGHEIAFDLYPGIIKENGDIECLLGKKQ